MAREELIHGLRAIGGDRYVLVEKEDVIVYEQDGSKVQVMPEVVVLPADVEQVAAVVKAARPAGVSIASCGSGTGLAGRKIA
jgi:glycolate oxidase